MIPGGTVVCNWRWQAWLCDDCCGVSLRRSLPGWRGGAVITAPPFLSHGDGCADQLRVWIRVAVIRGGIPVGEVW